MGGFEITGIVIAALIVIGIFINLKDIRRYIHISTM